MGVFLGAHGVSHSIECPRSCDWLVHMIELEIHIQKLFDHFLFGGHLGSQGPNTRSSLNIFENSYLPRAIQHIII